MEPTALDLEILGRSCEIIKDRLYFTLHPVVSCKSAHVHYFCVDSEFVYANFFADFGPLNLAMLYHYCVKVNKKLKTINNFKKIVQYTQTDPQKRVNAAFLMGAYSVIYLKKSPEEIHQLLTSKSGPSFLCFRDASLGASTYNLTLLDCFRGICKALAFGFFNFETFYADAYEHYERVENGDLNWIVPGKFLAFAGPHSKVKIANGYPLHSPETYIPYFQQQNVSTIIRLNKKMYSGDRFRQAGFDHFDLFFTDGSTPNNSILQRFLEICENAKGAIAVHCKAGLGRTGTLIGCYLMKHYKFSAAEAIAWIRIARPGSVIGQQQNYLDEKQPVLWEKNDISCVKTDKGTDFQKMVSAVDGMSIEDELLDETETLFNNNSMDCLSLEIDYTLEPETNELTQGDHLNRVKSRRSESIHCNITLRGRDVKAHSRRRAESLETDSAIDSTIRAASSKKTSNAVEGNPTKKRNLSLRSVSKVQTSGKSSANHTSCNLLTRWRPKKGAFKKKSHHPLCLPSLAARRSHQTVEPNHFISFLCYGYGCLDRTEMTCRSARLKQSAIFLLIYANRLGILTVLTRLSMLFLFVQYSDSRSVWLYPSLIVLIMDLLAIVKCGLVLIFQILELILYPMI